ncbi:hypothetical protein HDU93_002762 [Gonapodya sp. JEL0774]|nr:hypothetical protein HDU93_002762 [Gonapodya sp. JEL0774]
MEADEANSSYTGQDQGGVFKDGPVKKACERCQQKKTKVAKKRGPAKGWKKARADADSPHQQQESGAHPHGQQRADSSNGGYPAGSGYAYPQPAPGYSTGEDWSSYYGLSPSIVSQAGVATYLAPPNPYGGGHHPNLIRSTSDPASMTNSDAGSAALDDEYEVEEDDDELATMPVPPAADELIDRASASSNTRPRGDSDADSTDSVVSSLRSRSPRRRSGTQPVPLASSPGSTTSLAGRGKARSPAPYDIPPPRSLRGRVASDPRAGPYGGGRFGMAPGGVGLSPLWPAPGRSLTAGQATRGRGGGQIGGDEEVVDILTSMGRGGPHIGSSPGQQMSSGSWYGGQNGGYPQGYGYSGYAPGQPPTPAPSQAPSSYSGEWFSGPGENYDSRSSFYPPASYARQSGPYSSASSDHPSHLYSLPSTAPPPAMSRLESSLHMSQEPVNGNASRNHNGNGLTTLPSVSALLNQVDGSTPAISESGNGPAPSGPAFRPTSVPPSPHSSSAITPPPGRSNAQTWRNPHRSATDVPYVPMSPGGLSPISLSPIWDKPTSQPAVHSATQVKNSPPPNSASTMQSGLLHHSPHPTPQTYTSVHPMVPGGAELAKMDDDRVVEAIMSVGTGTTASASQSKGGSSGKSWDGMQVVMAEIAMLL